MDFSSQLRPPAEILSSMGIEALPFPLSWQWTAAITGVTLLTAFIVNHCLHNGWSRSDSSSDHVSLRAAAQKLRSHASRAKVPPVEHSWLRETSRKGYPTTCCVCLETLESADLTGADGGVDRCEVCGVAAHDCCTAKASKDCKNIALHGKVMCHHWVEGSANQEDRHDDTSVCMHCDEEVRYPAGPASPSHS